jgi:hypothetical protein
MGIMVIIEGRKNEMMVTPSQSASPFSVHRKTDKEDGRVQNKAERFLSLL